MIVCAQRALSLAVSCHLTSLANSVTCLSHIIVAGCNVQARAAIHRLRELARAASRGTAALGLPRSGGRCHPRAPQGTAHAGVGLLHVRRHA